MVCVAKTLRLAFFDEILFFSPLQIHIHVLNEDTILDGITFIEIYSLFTCRSACLQHLVYRISFFGKNLWFVRRRDSYFERLNVKLRMEPLP